MEFQPRPASGGFKLVSSLGRASDLASQPQTKLAAHVLKRGEKSTEWRRRFVVLKSCVALLYFDSEEDAMERAKGVMLLDERAALQVGSTDEGSTLVVVRASPNDSSARALQFRVDTAAEGRAWDQAMRSGLVSEAERLLESSRADTQAVHDTLAKHKAAFAEALQEQEEAARALAAENEGLREANRELAGQREHALSAQAEREQQGSQALAATAQAVQGLLGALAAGNASALDFLASSMGGAEGSSSSAAAASRKRAHTLAVSAAPPLPAPLTRSLSCAALQLPSATPSTSSSSSSSSAPPPDSTEAACAAQLAVAAEAAAAAAAQGAQLQLLQQLQPLHTTLLQLARAVDAAGALGLRSRAAYKALKARALEVGRIVGRLEAMHRGKAEEESAREAAWVGKERQWAAVVQALSVRLAREKERVASLAELLKAKTAALAAAQEEAAAAAAAAAAAVVAGAAGLSVPSEERALGGRSRSCSQLGVGLGGHVSAPAPAAAAAAAVGRQQGPFLDSQQQGRSSRAHSGSEEAGSTPDTPHLVAAAAHFAAGFVTPKKGLLEEQQQQQQARPAPGSSSSSSSSSSSAGHSEAEPALGPGAAESTDLERALGALQSTYSTDAGSGSSSSSSSSNRRSSSAAEEEGDGEEDSNPFGAPPSHHYHQQQQLARAATTRAPPLQPQQSPAQQQPQQQQQARPTQASRATPSALSKQQPRAPPATTTTAAPSSISIAHLTGGAAEHSAIRRAAEGALAGVGAKAFNIMGGLIKKAPTAAAAAGGSGTAQPAAAAAAAAGAPTAGATTAATTASAGAPSVLADPRQGRLYILVMGLRSLPEYSINKTPLRPGLVVRANVLGDSSSSSSSSAGAGASDERSSPVMSIVDVGRSRSLCSAIESVYAYKVAGLGGVRLRLEAHTVGTIRGGHKVGSAVVDVGALADDPGQPYALWAPLVTAEAEAGGESCGPLPGVQARAVAPTFQWAGAGAAVAVADSGGASVVEASAMVPVGSGSGRHGLPAVVPLSGIMSPGDASQPGVLLQMCFCLRPDDKPAFAQLPSGSPASEQQRQQQQQQQQQHQLGARGQGGDAEHHHLVVGSSSTPVRYPGEGGLLGAVELAHSPLPAGSSAASARLSKQVAILRKAFKGLVAEKQGYEDAAQRWAAEREVLRAQVRALSGGGGGGGEVEGCKGQQREAPVLTLTAAGRLALADAPSPPAAAAAAAAAAEGGSEAEGGGGHSKEVLGGQEGAAEHVAEEAEVAPLPRHALPPPLPAAVAAPERVGALEAVKPVHAAAAPAAAGAFSSSSGSGGGTSSITAPPTSTATKQPAAAAPPPIDHLTAALLPPTSSVSADDLDL